MKYADRRGFRLCLIAGENEFAAGQWQIKDLTRGNQISVASSDVAAEISKILLASE